MQPQNIRHQKMSQKKAGQESSEKGLWKALGTTQKSKEKMNKMGPKSIGENAPSCSKLGGGFFGEGRAVSSSRDKGENGLKRDIEQSKGEMEQRRELEQRREMEQRKRELEQRREMEQSKGEKIDVSTQTMNSDGGAKNMGGRYSIISDKNSMESFREQVSHEFGELLHSRSMWESFEEVDLPVKWRKQIKKELVGMVGGLREQVQAIRRDVGQYASSLSWHLQSYLEFMDTSKGLLQQPRGKEVLRGRLDNQGNETVQLHTLIDRLRAEMRQMHQKVIEQDQLLCRKDRESEQLRQTLERLSKATDSEGQHGLSPKRSMESKERYRIQQRQIEMNILTERGRKLSSTSPRQSRRDKIRQYQDMGKDTSPNRKQREHSGKNTERRLIYSPSTPGKYEYKHRETEAIILSIRERERSPGNLRDQRAGKSDANPSAKLKTDTYERPDFRERIKAHMGKLKSELGSVTVRGYRGGAEAVKTQGDRVLPGDADYQQLNVWMPQGKDNQNNSEYGIHKKTPLDSNLRKLSERLFVIKSEIESDLDQMKVPSQVNRHRGFLQD